MLQIPIRAADIATVHEMIPYLVIAKQDKDINEVIQDMYTVYRVRVGEYPHKHMYTYLIYSLMDLVGERKHTTPSLPMLLAQFLSPDWEFPIYDEKDVHNVRVLKILIGIIRNTIKTNYPEITDWSINDEKINSGFGYITIPNDQHSTSK